jgi:hypothetical protein
LRLYATSLKVAISIPDKVIEFVFNLLDLSSHTVPQKVTQPQTEMTTKKMPGE